MFLKKLSETEKQAFLCLATKAMKADSVVQNREMSAINALASEMGVANTASTLTEDEAWKVVSSSKDDKKRAMYLELLSIALADRKFHEDEKAYMNTVMSKFGLPETFTEEALKWVKRYYTLMKKGVLLVKGSEN